MEVKDSSTMKSSYGKFRRKRQSHIVIKLVCIATTLVVALNFLALYKFVDSKYNGGKKVHLLQTNENTYKVRKLLNSSVQPTPVSIGDYPDDYFTLKQKEQGWIALHCIGVMYMFLALAIVCDEFFVPALHVITSILQISDDVAGATFMAAGGSAPELFTSIIGLFFSNSQVGFGTIVGSAVFNVLFVIGMCAMFSKTLLNLTWWPLLRDSIFYIIALLLLIGFFSNGRISWYEALLLFLVYVAYVIFMMFNSRVELAVKSLIQKHFKSSSSSVTPADEKRAQTFLSFPSVFAKNTFRQGAMQLVIHTLDPIAEVAVENKFQQLKDQYDNQYDVSNGTHKEEISSSLIVPDHEENYSSFHSQTTMVDTMSPQRMTADKFSYELQTRHISVDKASDTDNESVPDKDVEGQFLPKSVDSPMVSARTTSTHYNSTPGINDQDSSNINGNPVQRTNSCNTPELQQKSFDNNTPNGSHVSLRNTAHAVRFTTSRSSSRRSSRRASCRSHRGLAPTLPLKRELSVDDKNDQLTGEEEDDVETDEDGPLDLSWPDGCLERIFYVIKAPLVFLMVIFIPDVRRPKLRKLYPVSFVMSILFIGLFSYFMLWMASEVGRTAGINVEIMGLTFIAAGTSIPDLITSVVVARQGLGDMAVSSSIGSNIFDVTVGLPLPWLAYSMAKDFKDVVVSSNGLFCSTLLLFLMLIAVVVTIALNKWRMTRLLGATMFGLYVVFITITILLQVNILNCDFVK